MNIQNRGSLQFIKVMSKHSTNKNVTTEEEYNNILKEWELIYTKQGKSNCICGKSIKNICIIHNAITKHTLDIGTCCALKLMYRDYIEHFNKKPFKEFLTNFKSSIDHSQNMNTWE